MSDMWFLLNISQTPETGGVRGVEVADAVRALVPVVWGAAACHMGSNPVNGTYENGRGDGPLHRRCLNQSKTGRQWKTSSG